MSEWISVREAKVPTGFKLLVDKNGDNYIGWLAVDGKWYDQEDPHMKLPIRNITHYMSLPRPPYRRTK